MKYWLTAYTLKIRITKNNIYFFYSMKIIACVAKNWVIWINNSLPRNRLWEDMKRFSHKTKDSVVIMWRKTYESLWKTLTERQMIVVSSTINEPFYNDENTIFLNDIKLVNRVANREIEYMWEWYKTKRDIYCIWWYTLYKYCLDEWLVDTARLTLLKHDYVWDTYFPYNSFYQSQKSYKLFFEKKWESSKINRFIWLSAQW